MQNSKLESGDRLRYENHLTIHFYKRFSYQYYDVKMKCLSVFLFLNYPNIIIILFGLFLQTKNIKEII